MTFWAKLLTVIVLVLSIVFAAASGAIFAKRQHYRKMLENSERKREVKVDELEKKLQTAEQEIQAKSVEIGTKTTEIAALTQQNETLRRERDNFQNELTIQRAHWDGFQAKMEKNSTALEIVSTQFNELADKYKNLDQENRKYMADLTEARTKISKLLQTEADLEKLRDTLQVELAAANVQLRHDDEIFTKLKKDNIDARTIIEALQPVQRIAGRVTYVDAATKMVVLNVGRADGVKKTFNFTVIRGGKYIGKISVFELGEGKCAGYVEHSEVPVQIGDSALTRLP